jgi:hypothetical protein
MIYSDRKDASKQLADNTRQDPRRPGVINSVNWDSGRQLTERKSYQSQ